MKTVQDLISGLLGELREHNPDISEDQFSQIRSQIEERIRNEPAPRVAFIGDTGVGKSTTLNALFNAGQEVGHIQATTKVEAAIPVYVDAVRGHRGALIAYDMPGLGESMATREAHLATYKRVLEEADVAIWIHEAFNRRLEDVQRFMVEQMPRMHQDLANRVVFALNKVDMVHPGESAWIQAANIPGQSQEDNIRAITENFRNIIRQALPNWRGEIVSYSAMRAYNLPALFAATMDAVAKKRRWVVAEHMDLADFFANVDPSLLPPSRQQSTSADK
jgi:uncharacterized protein